MLTLLFTILLTFTQSGKVDFIQRRLLGKNVSWRRLLGKNGNSEYRRRLLGKDVQPDRRRLLGKNVNAPRRLLGKNTNDDRRRLLGKNVWMGIDDYYKIQQSHYQQHKEQQKWNVYYQIKTHQVVQVV
eukprot:93198_1